MKCVLQFFFLVIGYLNESGTLNLPRFEAYMRKLGSFDIKQFREKYDDLRYLEKKTGKSGEPRVSVFKVINFRVYANINVCSFSRNSPKMISVFEETCNRFSKRPKKIM